MNKILPLTELPGMSALAKRIRSDLDAKRKARQQRIEFNEPFKIDTTLTPLDFTHPAFNKAFTNEQASQDNEPV